MKIVFYGTPAFAVASLEILIKNQLNVAAVVTAPDRPAGRGNRLQASAIKQCAIANNIPVLQPTNLKSEEFAAALSAIAPDLQIVVAFRMLPKVIWQLPSKGTFNLHASLLPQYRGAAPINWAIANGETETGVTTFFINEAIDTGAIISQRKVIITPEMNAGVLHDQLMVEGAKLVLETTQAIERGVAKAEEQENGTHHPLKLAPKITKATCRIDWSQSATQIINHIRAFSPYPGAWTKITYPDGKTIVLKIFEAKHVSIEEERLMGPPAAQNPPNTTPFFKTINKSLFLRSKDWSISIISLQIEGKKRMDVSSFMLGNSLLEEATIA